MNDLSLTGRPNQLIIFKVTLFKLLHCNENSQYKNNAHTYLLILLDRHLTVKLKLPCSSTLFHISHELPYVQYVTSNRYASFTKVSLHTLHIFILRWWCHDAASTPNLHEQVEAMLRFMGLVSCDWICYCIITLYW